MFHVISASCSLQFVPYFDDGLFCGEFGCFSSCGDIQRNTPMVRHVPPISNNIAVITYCSTGNMNSTKYIKFSMFCVNWRWCCEREKFKKKTLFYEFFLKLKIMKVFDRKYLKIMVFKFRWKNLNIEKFEFLFWIEKNKSLIKIQ